MASYYENAQPPAAVEDTGQPLAAIEDLIEDSHASTNWNLILNNTTSTRPKDCGGSLFRSLAEQNNFQQTGSTWSCTILMPCSFAPGDGLSFAVTTSAETEKKADAAACRSVLANLLMRDASAVTLRQTHWSCSTADLVHRIGEILQQQHQPLAVPPPRGSNYQAPIAGEETQREQDILQVLRSCCQFGTVCDPSDLRTQPGGFKPWSELGRLLPRRGLLPYSYRP